VIISICRDLGRPLIRTIALSALTPIPEPLAEIIRAYAESDLASPIEPDESIEEEQKIPVKLEFGNFPKKTTPATSKLHQLREWAIEQLENLQNPNSTDVDGNK
jgi:hypothetical protein